MNPKILLVEDEPKLAEAILLNLDIEGYDSFHISNGQQAASRILDEPEFFDLIVLDVMLPEMDGLEVCQVIREAGVQTPVLFLSARNTAEDKVRGLRTGADDYLGKPFNLEELLLRINILLNRHAHKVNRAPEQFSFPGGSINFEAFTIVTRSGEELSVGQKEIALLQMLIQKEGKVVSREEILDKVWKSTNVTGRTIDNHILSFRKWFEANPKQPQHFLSVRGVGYRFNR
ncbi:response regulator transcription factor [bacterium SCSIO 12741]|nr:response regulator transcription factor [bacterium SCSIO 12741]